MVADMNLSKAKGLAKVARDAAAIENIAPGEAQKLNGRTLDENKVRQLRGQCGGAGPVGNRGYPNR